ncbi:MAG: O-antigen ligase family protein [Symploca sp. SIO2E6]|nr:O-antigen ligase family protein [Symploca sp. SIO2E6]
MNQILKWAEPKLTVLALLIFSGVLGIASYNNPTFQVARGLGSGAATGYIPSPVDPLMKLLRYGIYASSLLLIIARFKTVVRPILRDPFLWALVGLVVFSFIWSDFPSISRKEAILTVMTTLFGVYLASRYSLKEQLQIVAWAAGIATVFSLLYTLALPGAGIEQGIHAGAWRGPLMQKNLFARLTVLCAVPLALVLNSNRKYRYVVWTVFGMTVSLILLSTSKTALVVFLSLMIVLPFYKALRWSSSFAVPFLISVVLVGASAGSWLMTNWVSFLGSLGRDATLTGRTEVWDAVIEKILERPWLGHGYKAFWQPGGGQDYVWYVFRITFTQSHNGYLDLTVELGIIGLLLFALSFIMAYFKAINWARTIKTPEGLWPLVYLTFIFMYNQTESTTVATNSLFWILYVAVTLSLRRVQLANTSEELEMSQKERLVELA